MRYILHDLGHALSEKKRQLFHLILKDPYPMRWHNAKSLAFDNENNMYVTFSAFTNSCEDFAIGYDDPRATGVGRSPGDDLADLGAGFHPKSFNKPSSANNLR